MKIDTMSKDIHDTKNKRMVEIGEGDLESLRKNDPFLYYSIPAIRRAAMFQRNIDHSNVTALCQGQINRSQSDPLSNSKTSKKIIEVARRSAISFEADPYALMEDFLQNEFADGDFGQVERG
mmetsp:Transcript_41002/g.87352  ORF Transcript_41002/g.87352 Transcript_41002/m.87352 type:complete len:122 (+) Transcript_41002:94-459(+)